MRTITKNLYSFSELSEQAKQTAIENFRNNDSEFLSEFLYQEAHESVKAFHNIFSTKEDLHSWLDVRTGHIDDVILELSGQRLATYIWNNYGHKLFKGKYYSLWSKTDRNYKHHKNGYPVLKKRRSKVMFEHSCVLTGVCWDNDLLKPIYDFLDKPTDVSFESLLTDCFDSLRNSLESAAEAQTEDDYIIEEIEANEYEFDEKGNLA